MEPAGAVWRESEPQLWAEHVKRLCDSGRHF